MNKQFEKLLNESSVKLKGKILEKLKLEWGLPQNWWDGRTSSNHTGYDVNVKRSYGDTNFERTKGVSGQEDIDDNPEMNVHEHHEEYPPEILNMTVGEFLDNLKGKSEEHYNHVEDMIEKFFMNDTEQPMDEGVMKDIDIIAQDSKDFKSFITSVFKEFKDLKKSKESVTWLKSVYASKTNESINEDKPEFNVDPGFIGTWKNKLGGIAKVYKMSKGFVIEFASRKSAKQKDSIKLKYPNDVEKKLKELGYKYWTTKGMQEDKVPGGLSDGKSLQDIANHHKIDIDQLLPEFRKGLKVELEHTTDKEIAIEISKDHLMEDPNYYTKLDKMENESVNESVTLTVHDIAPLLVPRSERLNLDLHKDLAKVINAVLKKYGVSNIKLKEGAFDKLNSIQDARETMANFIVSARETGGKSDKWWDNAERVQLKKSFANLKKDYEKLGGKPIKLKEGLNEDENSLKLRKQVNQLKLRRNRLGKNTPQHHKIQNQIDKLEKKFIKDKNGNSIGVK